jgi:hypothetical protein
MQRRTRSEDLTEVLIYLYEKPTHVIYFKRLSHQKDCVCLFSDRLEQRNPAKGKAETAFKHTLLVRCLSTEFKQNRDTDSAP